MNGKELHMRTRRPLPSVLVLTFMLCLTVFGERALFAANPSPAPRVFFDQTVIPTAATCPLATTKPPDVPPQGLIGEPFTFRVRFKNDNAPKLVSPIIRAGFGPFIDLVLDAGGANVALAKPASCGCDGMTFISANLVGVNGGAVPLKSYQSVAPPCTSSLPVSPNHPFNSSGVPPVNVPVGSQLVTLELPFGNYDPTQPEIVIEVTAFVSANADVNQPLNIYARGGFRYGKDEFDNSSSGDLPVVSDLLDYSANPASQLPTNQQLDPTLWAARAQTTPTVMIVTKKYLGLEDENATGPNITSNTPRQYEIAVDIAKNQNVTFLTLADTIPLNMVLDSFSATPTGYTSTPLPNGAGIWTITWPTTITGVQGPDVIIDVAFHVPERDANHALVLPADCGYVHSVNTVQASCSWQPSDTCDGGPVQLISTAQHDLLDKCLAIQKSVAVDTETGAAGFTPDDKLKYTLNFQLSDFKTAGNLKIQDFLSDGQTLLPASLTLTVTDQCGTTSTTPGNFPSTAWTQTPLACVAGTPPPRTELDIDISQAMVASPGAPFRHTQGILTGGYAFAPTSTSPVPAKGTITFLTKIDDAYLCLSPPHEFVDKDDPLTNTVTLTADILANGGTCLTPPSPIGVIAKAHDDSKTCIAIVTDFLDKTVYAVKRGSAFVCGPGSSPFTPCTATPPPEVLPGDEVTFRLTKTIPSSDAESLTIQDWLPQPILNVDDPHATGTPGYAPSWNASFNLATCVIPASGNACLLPSDTLSTWPGLVTPPTLHADLGTNSITFNYGTFNDSTNTPRKIDLLFTLTVTNNPFADRLYLTNEARECESNSFGVTFCQTAIAQVHVREPALKITKGVVAATNPNAVFSPPPHTQVGPIGPVPFSAPGSGCPRFSQVISSTGSPSLALTPIDSDVFNVDANDCITFAIVVENTGGSPAYDVQLRDLYDPSCFSIPVLVPNTFCLTDGTGFQLAAIPGTASSGTLPIALALPLPGLGPTPGKNIAVFTFDACIVGDVKPGCCNDTAKLDNYASTPGGPNFVGTGFGGAFQDSAEACIRPTATKSIKTTSEGSTPGPPLPALPEQLAIGEIIRYHLAVVVPETSSASNYTLTDLLSPGLRFVDDHTTKLAFVSNGPSGPGISSTGPLGIGTAPFMLGNLATVTPTFVLQPMNILGGPFDCNSSPSSPIFNLGDLKNTDNDSDQEFIVLEFNARVCNIASNVSGTPLPNSFTVLAGSQQVPASNTVQAVVVEPNITITKAATVLPSLIPTAVATYTVTLTNNGTATAFDVHVTDQLPACLTKLSVSVITTSGGVTGLIDTSTSSVLDLTIGSIPVGGTVTVTYTATVTCVDCSKLINTAKVTWTSLPGPQGTTAGNPPNTTDSSAGLSGTRNGERTGTGGVNNYVATASATLCCMLVTNENISCNPNGTYTYAFTVKNFSNFIASGVAFSPPSSPPNVTVTPGLITGFPLHPGDSTTVTVTIGGTGAVPGANVCFTVALTAPGVGGCVIDQCITLPKCCVPPPSGMEAWYPLDEGVGATSVADISGKNHNGTPQLGPVGMNGPLPNVPNPPAVVGGSLDFFSGPSVLAYVTVPDTPPLSLDIGSGDFTIDAWVYENAGPPPIVSGPAPIVDKFDATLHTGYRLYLGAPFTVTSATLYFSYGDGSSSLPVQTVQSISPISFHQWHYVAVTVKRSSPPAPSFEVLFYVDGTSAQVGQSLSIPVGIIANTLDLFIGGFHPPPPTTGATEIAIDELEIFHRALSQTEIQGIFNAGSAGKCRLGRRPGVAPVPSRPPVRHVPFH